MMIDDLISIVNKYPENIAYDNGDKKYSYSGLLSGVNDYVKFMSDNKLINKYRNERIGLIYNNSIDFVCVMLAAAYHNISICVFEEKLPSKEIIKSCNISAVKLIMSCADISAIGEEGKLTVVIAKNVIKSSYNESSIFDFKRLNEKNDEYITQFSSGSTGMPKGVLVSQKSIQERYRKFSASIGLNEKDSILCVLTFTHAHGSDVLLWPSIFSGAKLVAPQDMHLTGRKILKYLESKEITVFSSLPLHYDLMNEVSSVYNLQNLRLCISASAPLRDLTRNEFYKKCKINIKQAYGNTEFGVIAACPSKSDCGMSVGKIIQGIDWMLNDEGELLVKGEAAYSSYLLSNDNVKKYNKDKWFNTHDVVDVDKHGLINIIDRTSSFINVSGNKVSPSEIEEEIKKINSINEACVFGCIQDDRDEAVIAYVITDDSKLSSDDIKINLSEKLPNYKIPTQIEFVKSFPVSNLGKLLRTEIKESHNKTL